MEAADVAYGRSRTASRELRRRSSGAARALYREVVALRRLVKGFHGAEAVEESLGICGDTPREPWQLLTLGQLVVSFLKKGLFTG